MAFDSDKKLQIIQAVRDAAEAGKWPGIHRICRTLSVSPSAFYNHLDEDAEFKAQYDEALLALEDSLVDNLVRQGQGANGVTANIFLLKNRWPKRWNEEYWLNYRGDNGQIKSFLHGNEPFIDAEVVDKKDLSTINPESGSNSSTVNQSNAGQQQGNSSD